MQNVILVIHLILALCLVGIVLLQRSEGGGLGIGGGGGGGVMSGRSAATALGKLTWIFAGLFLATSIALTILAARNAAQQSVLDRPAATAPTTTTAPATPPSVPKTNQLLPPKTPGAPLTPPPAN